jgi:hypothetical protein
MNSTACTHLYIALQKIKQDACAASSFSGDVKGTVIQGSRPSTTELVVSGRVFQGGGYTPLCRLGLSTREREKEIDN